MDALFNTHLKYLVQAVPIDWKNYCILFHCINLHQGLKLVDDNQLYSDLSQVTWNNGEACTFTYTYPDGTAYHPVKFTFKKDSVFIKYTLQSGLQTLQNSIYYEELLKIDFTKVNWQCNPLQYYATTLEHDLKQIIDHNKPWNIPVSPFLNPIVPQNIHAQPILNPSFGIQMNPFESGNLMGPESFQNGPNWKVRFDHPFMTSPDNDEFIPGGGFSNPFNPFS